MDSNISLCLERADNELALAGALELLSGNEQVKKEIFNIDKTLTFYSAVISHSYYSIFYGAKAYLISKGIVFSKQGQHQKVYQEFCKLVKKRVIDEELLKIYEDAKVKAEVLLDILIEEKDKRSEFTYEKLPQANKLPAQNSIKNARFFVSHMKELIKKQ